MSVETVVTGWVKVKVTFTSQPAKKTQRRNRGTVFLFNFGTRWGWVVNTTPRPLYPGNDRVPLV
jgi:hypothetical protein